MTAVPRATMVAAAIVAATLIAPAARATEPLALADFKALARPAPAAVLANGAGAPATVPGREP